MKRISETNIRNCGAVSVMGRYVETVALMFG